MKPTVNCPTCQKKSVWSNENQWRPFCCERCRMIDFGDWANESNTIAGETEVSNFDQHPTDEFLQDDK